MERVKIPGTEGRDRKRVFLQKPFMVIYGLVFTFALLNLGKLAILPGILALKH
jgi:hypothetical protein